MKASDFFRWNGSLTRTSELLSFCVEQKLLTQACCDERRTDGQFGAVWDLPVWPSSSWTLQTLTANLSAFTSQGSSSRSCSFFLSHLSLSVFLFLYFSAPSCFFPPFTHNLTPSLHLSSLNLSLSHHGFMSSFFQSYCTAGRPSPFLSVYSLLEQTYEKSWQLSQRSFHKQHKASDNWSGCVAAGLSEGLALWVSNCSGSLAELRALHKLSVMWCRSQMACLRVHEKKKKQREMENMCVRENGKRQKTVRRTKGEMIHYSTCHVVTAGFL